MQTDPDDMHHDMPSDFEVLEVRRALLKGRAAEPDVDQAWHRFRRSLEGDAVASGELQEQSSKHGLAYILCALCAACLVLAFVLTIFLKPRHNGSVQVFTADKGTPQLTLTADDGNEQVVSDRSLTFNRPVASVQHIRMLEVSNPRGKVSKVVLPDGSTVWLNADSHLSFPERFVGKTRDVSLSGEAYFCVKHDARHPFVVTTEQLVTTVHGTVFDVCAYPSKPSHVALLMGSVAVKNPAGEERFVKPGQMASLASDGSIALADADTYSIGQWTEGFFYFGDTRLIDIMMELGRWYNVNIVFENEATMNLRLHFVAEHTDKLSDIVKRINDLCGAHVSLSDDVVTVR